MNSSQVLHLKTELNGITGLSQKIHEVERRTAVGVWGERKGKVEGGYDYKSKEKSQYKKKPKFIFWL